MSRSDGLTPTESAVVFRRAAELEAAGLHGEAAGLLDPATLEGIGREAGLSPASVRAALAEYRNGALDAIQRNADIVSSRVVPGGRREVCVAIDEFARRNLLLGREGASTTLTWGRRPGVSAAILRSFGGKKRHPLVALRELRAAVADHPDGPGLVRVRLEGTLVFPTGLLPLGAKLFAAGGVGAGATGLALAVPELAAGDAVLATGASIAVTLGAAGAGVRAYRASVARTETALDGFLDRLERGQPAWMTVHAPSAR
jgi:hypothetical protein